MMKPAVLFFAFWLALSGSATADWVADPTDKRQLAAQKAVATILKKKPELQEWFDQAYGYAVFPRVWRAGAMWSGAWGRGVTIEGDKFIGYCAQYSGGLGPQLGFQTYKQVILFKNEAALRIFKSSHLEFQGRASLAWIVVGDTANPSYIPDVAIFSLTEAGLMVEASANIAWLRYKKPKNQAN